MTTSPQPDRPATAPGVDLGAVLAAMEDQLDDLAAAVQAQQQTIDAQQRTIRELVGAQRAARTQRLPADGPGLGRR